MLLIYKVVQHAARISSDNLDGDCVRELHPEFWSSGYDSIAYGVKSGRYLGF